MHQIDITQLHTYLQLFPEESATINAFEHFLQQSQPIKQSIKGSAWIINAEDSSVLLHFDQRNNTWTPHICSIESNNTQQPLIDIIKTSIIACVNLSSPQPITHHPFHIQIGLDKQAEKPFYYFNICYQFLVENRALDAEIDTHMWVPLVDILTTKKYATVKPLAKKWQLMHYSNAMVTDKI